MVRLSSIRDVQKDDEDKSGSVVLPKSEVLEMLEDIKYGRSSYLLTVPACSML